jgi:hypothetical protein
VRRSLASSVPARRWLTAAGVLAVLVAIPLIVYLVGVPIAPAPDTVVRDYLGALGRRDAATARVQLAGGGAAAALLSAATVRNAGYHPPRLLAVRAGRVTDGRCNVQVSYQVDGRAYDLTLTVVRAGGGLLTHPWRIRGGLLPLPLPPAYLLSRTLNVAGTPVGTGQTEIGGVFPGGYEIVPPGSPIYRAAPLTVVAGAGQEPRLALSLRDSARSAIATQVRQYLDACARSTELAPPDCPFRAWVSVEGMTSLTWQVVTYPALTVTLNLDGTALVAGGYGVVRCVQLSSPGARPYVQNIEFTLRGVGRDIDGKVVFVASLRATDR